MGFQYPYSPVMEGIIDLHHDICFYLVIVLIFVSYLLWKTYKISIELTVFNKTFLFFSPRYMQKLPYLMKFVSDKNRRPILENTTLEVL